ncbi:MAG: HD domain-containing protein [Sedimentisphaerales bacterium]|nr:HD domain-containing protein [Sedimentisphaerales bacterium]
MPSTIPAGLTASQAHELKEFGGRVANLGANFVVCDGTGKAVILCKSGAFDSDPVQLAKIADDCLRHPPKGQSPLNPHTPMSRYVAVPLIAAAGDGRGKPLFAALIDTGPGGERQNPDSTEFFAEILRLFGEKFIDRNRNAAQMDMISSELAQTYEELVLLYKISTNMEIVEPDANFLQMACDSLTEIVSVEGIAIVQEKTMDEQSRFVLIAGAGVIDIDERMTLTLYHRLLEEMSKGKEALLDSEVDAPFRYEWPKNIRNIIVVPLCGKEKAGFGERRKEADSQKLEKGEIIRQPGTGRVIGMLVAINRKDKPDFDSTDVKLFNSVASECAVFVENNRLFNDLKELFIGSLKALTRSIDAKDRYTRGHSERVAFISKWIAEHLAEQRHIEQEQVHKIYLAGLLHDIGKIGIDEKVLCKTGKLTERERSQLMMHPSIGANILSSIKQMRDIIPGVLYHHERVDGKGYPNALKGDEIPLMGKIVGLADCFDAMTSERVYQEALDVEEAIDEIEKRLGTQFDKEVGEVFIKSDVYHLWDLMQEGSIKTYGSDDFTQYGTMAVGTLIK